MTAKCPVAGLCHGDNHSNNKENIESKCPVTSLFSNNNNDTSNHKKTKHFDKNDGIFNASKIISSEKNKKKKALPRVQNLGCITLKELNEYDCNHETRQLLSIFGTIFDVTAATDKYGKDGVYKEFAGHDITLCLGTGKLQEKWLDRFVQLNTKHSECAKGWIPLYQKQYPTAGILEKWSENTKKWPCLTPQELKELNAECLIM